MLEAEKHVESMTKNSMIVCDKTTSQKVSSKIKRSVKKSLNFEKSFNEDKQEKIDLHKQWQKLVDEKESNTELLRKLKLIKTHREKNNLTTLDQLINKWTNVCQDALSQLHSYAPKQPPMTMLQLIYCLQIDPKTVCFDNATNNFYKLYQSDKGKGG